jgi:hypothetical protein
MPNAIQPHCVLLVSSFLLDAAAAPAAAAAAGLTPEVVVAATVVVSGAATGAVCVGFWVVATVTVRGGTVSVTVGDVCVVVPSRCLAGSQSPPGREALATCRWEWRCSWASFES